MWSRTRETVETQVDAERHDATAADEVRLWREDNAEAIGAWNRYVEANGLPLADLRQF